MCIRDRNKYTYYASAAKKEGYVQIGNLFEETANNEKEHAKIWFKPVSYTHLDVYKRQFIISTNSGTTELAP